MVAEVFDSLQRHGIDGIRPDQLLGIKNITVGRVFRAGTGPQWALHVRAAMFERLKARRVENALELLIDQASIGDGGFAF